MGQSSNQKIRIHADGHMVAAQSPRRRKLPVVLLLLPQNLPINRQIIAAVARKKWHSLDLAFRRRRVPESHLYQGAFIAGNPRDRNVIKMLRAGKSIVRLGYFPNVMDTFVPAVMPDWDAVGRLAAQHFAERDFKNVGFIGREPWQHFQQLFCSFQEHAYHAGLACHLLSAKQKKFHDNYDYIKSQILAWLETLPLPIGILAFSDRWAAELVYICSEAGYALPEQVAILGIGNDPEIVNACVPNLSSIDLDDARMVETSIDLLARMMRGTHPMQPTTRIPPKGVVVRTSTEILAVQDQAALPRCGTFGSTSIWIFRLMKWLIRWVCPATSWSGYSESISIVVSMRRSSANASRCFVICYAVQTIRLVNLPSIAVFAH